MRQLKYLLIILASALLSQSCSTTKSHFDLLRVKSEKLQSASDTSITKNRVEGKSCISHYLFIPTALDKTYELATKNALRDYPNANALKDVQIWETFFFGIVYGFSCYKISGVPTLIH